MKITNREEYIIHRNVYRSLANFLMVIRLLSIIVILVLVIFASAYSFIGKEFKETFLKASDILRWLVYVCVALWIALKIIVVYYKNNLKSAKTRINDIVDEV